MIWLVPILESDGHAVEEALAGPLERRRELLTTLMKVEEEEKVVFVYCGLSACSIYILSYIDKAFRVLRCRQIL
jgi:hypothetical protein